TLPVQRWPHMDVVEEGAPSRIVTTIGAGEANHVSFLLGDEDALIRGWFCQPLLPHSPPILENGAVQKLISVGAAVCVPPTLGMERGNREAIRVGRYSVIHRNLFFLSGKRVSEAPRGGARVGRRLRFDILPIKSCSVL